MHGENVYSKSTITTITTVLVTPSLEKNNRFIYTPTNPKEWQGTIPTCTLSKLRYIKLYNLN